MIVRKHLSFRKVIEYSWRRLLTLLVLSTVLTVLYLHLGYKQMAISTTPATILGTALSILLGFRGNSTYDR